MCYLRKKTLIIQRSRITPLIIEDNWNQEENVHDTQRCDPDNKMIIIQGDSMQG